MSRSLSHLPSPCSLWASPVPVRALARPGRPAARLGALAPTLAALAVAVCLLFVSNAALAFGSVRLKTATPDEEEGVGWNLVFDIDYGRVPDMPHVPMMFTFVHTVEYEWSITDASPDKPVFNRKPLVGQVEINLPEEVSFADLTGKVWKMTKGYKLTLRRDGQFAAGEYTLTVHQEGGGPIGQPMHIVLGGKNEPVERRSVIDIATAKGQKKAAKKDADASDKGGKEGQGTKDEFANLPSGDVEPENQGPPAEKPKQGGCGCRVVGAGARAQDGPLRSPLAPLLLGAFGFAVWRRRRG